MVGARGKVGFCGHIWLKNWVINIQKNHKKIFGKLKRTTFAIIIWSLVMSIFQQNYNVSLDFRFCRIRLIFCDNFLEEKFSVKYEETFFKK